MEGKLLERHGKPTEEEAIRTQKFSDLRKNDLENTDYVVAWLSFAAMI